MNKNKNKHLILDERYVIEHFLNENMSFKAIGKRIFRSCTTVSKVNSELPIT
ncbi:helix-turn-helix domain-containing protein [Falcatimonas sp. MSJ-15]|uniref:helix-turn-helix domain-containing protein n=1 Tax=Falcatimonas sp. MSJ-15 TaxID=2841515 RepID=UPI001C1135F2|nr:helix-turn-helix domain-containing protein [Falcatimonas sp. MSJ-15]